MIKKLFFNNNKNQLIINSLFKFSTVPKWATCDPYTLSGSKVHTVQNLIQGKWKNTEKYQNLVDPLNGEVFMKIPMVNQQELGEFVDSAKSCPKSGVFNQFKKPENYVMWGDINFKIAQELRKNEVEDYFTKLIQRVCPKSDPQARGEVVVTRKFFENFSGDNVRFMVNAFQTSGDHQGQRSTQYRWPHGSVQIISPFNFPLEIPALQLYGALYVGNKPNLRQATKMSVVMEQFLRMAIHLGQCPKSVDLLHCGHQIAEEIVKQANFRLIQFTGSSGVAERLAVLTHGKVKIEDAGFNWKILGPDVADVDYTAWQSDQDAYAGTGQKCSAQSILYAHKNWVDAGIFDKISSLAKRRKLEDLTVAPVITWTNKQIQEQVDKLLKIPGSRVLFGGKQLQNHQIPVCYGSYEPTAIFVPIEQINEHFDVVNTEVFGPLQVVTQYNDNQLDLILSQLERQTHHLTAGIVSANQQFIEKIVGSTVNGVTYTGIRARTTGAPQNHFFGPCGDPRGAGIGTKEAILMVWTHPREVISDNGPYPANWTTPKSS